MKPASTDPFPSQIAIVRGRRRSIELSLEEGALIARVPRRISQRELSDVLPRLRVQLWSNLRRSYVFDDESLDARAQHVARTVLGDLELPRFTARFSRRQKKRWGSCTHDGGEGRIRISARLIGHPTWVLDHILLHELAHLRVIDHGPRFQALVERSPDHERGQGYLEALESVDRLGPVGSVGLEWVDDHDDAEQLPLFQPGRRAAEA